MGHRRGHRGDHRLRQPRIIEPRGQRALTVRAFDASGIVDHDHIQIRGSGQAARAKRSHPDQHRTAPGRRPVTAREFVDHHRPEPAQHRPRQIGILRPHRRGINQPAQVMHPDPEMPFLGPSTTGIQPRLIILFGLQRLCQTVDQSVLCRPFAEEIPTYHRVEHLRIARQIGTERGRGADDIDKQIRELRVDLQQREQLHPRGQPTKKAVKGQQCLIRFGGPCETRQQSGFQLCKKLRPPGAAQGGVVQPTVHNRSVKDMFLGRGSRFRA